MWRLRLTQSLIMLTVRVRSFEKRTNFPHSSVRLLAFTCVRFHLLDAIGKSDARPSCAAGAVSLRSYDLHVLCNREVRCFAAAPPPSPDMQLRCTPLHAGPREPPHERRS